MIYYLGKECQIVPKKGRGVSTIYKINDKYELWLYGEMEFTKRKVCDFYKKEADKIIKPLVKEYARQLDVKWKKISYKNMRSIWGSAHHNGNLSFSWRIIMANIEIIKYVVAHEVSHLKVMNHSTVFWQCCRKICPETDKLDKWLKVNGHIYLNIDLKY